jgi:perosamine synthetase
MTGYQAAMGLAQLRRIDRIIAEKRRVASTYNEHLNGIPGLHLPVERDWARNVYWMYAVVVNAEFRMSRDELANALRNEGIDSRTFFCPMNQQPCLKAIPGFRATQCPVADRIWGTGLYLPSTNTLSADTIRHIADAIRRISRTGRAQ